MRWRIRTATTEDLPAAIGLLNAAYGPNPNFDGRLRRYVATEPEGWVVADGATELIGVGGFVAFGRCAYIGLMGVSPNAQRAGIGTAIFESLLERCDARGHSLLLLDASDAGAPLYEKYGFRDHGEALAFALDPTAAGTASHDESPRCLAFDLRDQATVAEVTELDARAYGADRARLLRYCLRESPDRAFLVRDASGALAGYAIVQGRSFGPCVARSSDVARALLRHGLTLPYESRLTWFMAGQNREAASLARELAGEPLRRWRHMRRGDETALASDWSTVFAKLSLATG